MKKDIVLFLIIFFLCLLFIAQPVFAQNAYTLSGNAQKLTNPLLDKSVQLTSDFSDESSHNDQSAIHISIPQGKTFDQLGVLAATYNVTDDGCGGNSPRFEITINIQGEPKRIPVYIGKTPDFTKCAIGNQPTGNLVTEDARRFDLKEVGDTTLLPFKEAVEKISSAEVTDVQFIVDGGKTFADKEQTILVKDVFVEFEK